MYDPSLDTFLIVAEAGSFTQAAQKLFCTPASVMHQINAFEKRLDLVLFERSPQGLVLTPAGKTLLDEAPSILESAERVIKKARQAQETFDRTIRIGTSFLNPCQPFLEKWKHSSWNFQMVAYDDDHHKILSVIERLGKDIDVLVGAFNSKKMHQRAAYLPLGTYDLCVAMADSHPLAQKEVLNIEDLYEQTFLIPRQEVRNDFVQFLEKHPRIQVTSDSYYYDLSTFERCLKEPILLLSLSAWRDIHPLLISRPVNWDLKTPYGLLYKGEDQRVVRFIKEAKDLYKKREE